MLSKKHSHRRCMSCGDPLKDYRSMTCPDVYCRAVSMLNRDQLPPWRRDRSKEPARWKGHGQTRQKLLKLLRACLLPDDHERAATTSVRLRADVADWLFPHLVEGDRRGSGDKAAQDDVWGRLSRVKVMMRAVGKMSGEPALTICREPGQSTADAVRHGLMGGSGLDTTYKYFMAWRCGCSVGHEVLYQTIDDLPPSAGYHNPCPVCGAAAVEITDGP